MICFCDLTNNDFEMICNIRFDCTCQAIDRQPSSRQPSCTAAESVESFEFETKGEAAAELRRCQSGHGQGDTHACQATGQQRYRWPDH
jgi:hypothetical protein